MSRTGLRSSRGDTPAPRDEAQGKPQQGLCSSLVVSLAILQDKISDNRLVFGMFSAGLPKMNTFFVLGNNRFKKARVSQGDGAEKNRT
jgi:hypothetical protein